MMKKLKGLLAMLALLALLVSVCAPALAETGTQSAGPLKDSNDKNVEYSSVINDGTYVYYLYSGSYTLGSSDRGVRIFVNGDVTVTLDNANITSGDALDFESQNGAESASATLVLKGKSTLTSTRGYQNGNNALYSGIPLTIKEDDSAGGSLKLVADESGNDCAHFESDLTLKTKNVTFDSSKGRDALAVNGQIICDGDFFMGGKMNENEPWSEFTRGTVKFAQIFEGKTLPQTGDLPQTGGLPQTGDLPQTGGLPQTGDPSMLGAWVCLLGASAAGLKLRRKK